MAIHALRLHELLVGSRLRYLPVLYGGDDVSVPDGRQSMGDDDGGAAQTSLVTRRKKTIEFRSECPTILISSDLRGRKKSRLKWGSNPRPPDTSIVQLVERSSFLRRLHLLLPYYLKFIQDTLSILLFSVTPASLHCGHHVPLTTAPSNLISSILMHDGFALGFHITQFVLNALFILFYCSQFPPCLFKLWPLRPHLHSPISPYPEQLARRLRSPCPGRTWLRRAEESWGLSPERGRWRCAVSGRRSSGCPARPPGSRISVKERTDLVRKHVVA